MASKAHVSEVELLTGNARPVMSESAVEETLVTSAETGAHRSRVRLTVTVEPAPASVSVMPAPAVLPVRMRSAVRSPLAASVTYWASVGAPVPLLAGG